MHQPQRLDGAAENCGQNARLPAGGGSALLLPWGASEIVANLYVGDLQDAVKFDGMIISVLGDRPDCEPRRAIELPFLLSGRARLDTIAAVIDAALKLNLRLLVHCEEGSERAPLVVAWYLATRRGMTLDQAYDLLKARRPIIRDRRKWLGNITP
jgi:hypothetical protein